MATYNDAFSVPLDSSPLHSISIVDVFFPGLSTISVAFQQLLAGNLNSFAGLLGICSLFAFSTKYFYLYLEEFVKDHLTRTVYVPGNGEMLDMVEHYLSLHRADECKTLLARVGPRKRFIYIDAIDGAEKKPLKFVPWNGSFVFRHNGCYLRFRCKQQVRGHDTEEEVSISCFGRSSQPVKEFLQDCRTTYLKQTLNKTTIFENNDEYWRKTSVVAIRPTQTVALRRAVRDELFKDIENFLLSETQEKYARTGAPYRRGYLFHGPPGTGKTSLALAIAGHFGMDLYVLSLSGVSSDSSLKRILQAVPRRTVLLLEDIDATDSTKSRGKDQNSVVEDELADRPQKATPNAKVTLSGILNAIDGVGLPETRLCIMTTNYPENLDAALMRPGRVDLKVEMGLADQEIIHDLFCNAYKHPVETERGANIERLATLFAEKVPQGEFSAAELQSHFQLNMSSPQMALANVEGWMEKMREGKGEL